MKKVVILFIFAILLSGCGSSKTPAPTPTPSPTQAAPTEPPGTPTPVPDPLETASFSGEVLAYSDGWRTISVKNLIDPPANVEELKAIAYSSVVYICFHAGKEDRFPSDKASSADGCDIHYTAVIDDNGSEKEILSLQVPHDLVDLIRMNGMKKSLKYYERSMKIEIDPSIPE